MMIFNFSYGINFRIGLKDLEVSFFRMKLKRTYSYISVL